MISSGKAVANLGVELVVPVFVVDDGDVLESIMSSTPGEIDQAWKVTLAGFFDGTRSKLLSARSRGTSRLMSSWRSNLGGYYDQSRTPD